MKLVKRSLEFPSCLTVEVFCLTRFMHTFLRKRLFMLVIVDGFYIELHFSSEISTNFQASTCLKSPFSYMQEFVTKEIVFTFRCPQYMMPAFCCSAALCTAFSILLAVGSPCQWLGN